ncbi:MAG: glycosyltransferase family 4 protein [Patescibacteria group bacterium]|nr:glycosyltransferase family 4 protein [Patescibacteria group bacterium]
MKICYVLNSGDPGGVEQHVLDLTRGMVERGHEVYVVCPWGKMVNKYFEIGAQVRIDKPQLDVDPFYISRLARFINKIQPDILHVHMLKTTVNGLIASKVFRLSSRILGQPGSPTSAGEAPGAEKCGAPSLPASSLPYTVAHIHTPLPEWQIPGWKKKLNIFVNRIISNWAADVVIALTESRKRVKIEGEGIDPKKIRVIPNGVDTKNIKLQISNDKADYRKKLGIREDAILVGTLSRLTVEKGISYLIEAVPKWPTYKIQDTKCEILIGGSGELREELEDRARELGLQVCVEEKSAAEEAPGAEECGGSGTTVRFLGFVPEDEKWDYLAALDIFVFPSLAEGFGISLIEAMVTGCACLASDLEVLQEVGGETVEFFRAGDPQNLAKRLAVLIKDKEKRQSLGDRAQKRVEKKYSLELVLDNYENLYKELRLNFS